MLFAGRYPLRNQATAFSMRAWNRASFTQAIQLKAFVLKGGKTWKGLFVIFNHTPDGTQLFSGPGEMVITRVEVHPRP